MITIRPRKGEAGGEDRYARLREIPWWDQEVLAAARVIVVGAGALGNEVLKNLALLGIGSITIVDHDRIETSNLTRSVLFRRGDVGAWKAEVARDRVVEMNPDCRVEALCCDVIFDLGLGRFRRADVVFGCLDNLAARFFLNKFCYRTKTPYLDAALDHLNGDVRIFVPPEGACYECGMSEHDRRTLRKRVSCLKTALPPIERHIPTTPTISAIIAGLQVQYAVRLLHGKPIPRSHRIGYYGLSDLFFDAELLPTATCTTHAYSDPLPLSEIHELPLRATETTMGELFETVRKELGLSEVILDLYDDRDLVVALRCPACRKETPAVGVVGKLTEAKARCPACGEIRTPHTVASVEAPEDFGDHTLLEIGIPPGQILAFRDPAGSALHFFELSADL